MRDLFFPNPGIAYRINNFQKGRPTLVFIHGLTGSASAWFEYEKILESEFNILTFDLRGHGKSTKPKSYQDYAIENLAQDLHAIITQLQIEQCVLISHSFGTLIALEFLLHHKDTVAAAIFLSPNYGVHKTVLVHATQFLVGIVATIIGLFPISATSGGRIDYSQYPNAGDWDIKLNIADIRNTTMAAYLFCLKQIYSTERDNFWSHIDAPSLIIHGKQDSIIPVENAIAMAGKIRNSKLILLDKANHLFVLNDPVMVCKLCHDFIAQTLKHPTRTTP